MAFFACLVALSGCCGLAYEVLWMRALSLVFGQAPQAVASVLAVFMLGTALGAATLGRLVDRLPVPPLVIYAGLELLLALSALLVPFALDVARPAALAAASTDSGAFAAVNVAVALLVLGPPTVIMGATLPVLARVMGGSEGTYQRRLAGVYGLQTVGAALGALGTTFWLLPSLGLRVSLCLVPTASVAVGLGALALSRMTAAEAAPATSAPQASAPVTGGVSCPRWLWGMLFGSGFLVFVLEVALSRLCAILLGQSTFGFGLMLCAFVAGLGGGALVASRVTGRGDPRLGLLVLACVGSGVLLAAVPWLLQEASLAGASAALSAAFLGRLGPQFALKLALALSVLLPPLVLLGLVFPLVLGWVSASSPRRSARVGSAYAVNTVGSVLGIVLGALVFVPLLGPDRVILGVALVSVALGGALAAMTSDRGIAQRWAFPLLGLLLTLGMILGGGGLRHEMLLRSPHLYIQDQVDIDSYRGTASPHLRRELLYARSDAVVTVGVARSEELQGGRSHLFFSVNGKIDGGSSRTDMLTQVRLADWPLAIASANSAPRRALVIGLGTGVTVAAALRFPLQHVDVVEISPAVVEAAERFFSDITGSVLRDLRVGLVVNDARHVLATTREPYDVIISEPSNPWMAGVGFLFTSEAFAEMKRCLAPGGVVAQWVQTYQLSEELFASVVATFTGVFPESYLALTSPEARDFLLLGIQAGERTARLSLPALVAVLEDHRPAVSLQPYSLCTRDDLLFGLIAGPEALQRLSRGAARNTDDNGLLEFGCAKLLMPGASGIGLPTFKRLHAEIDPPTAIALARETALSDRNASRSRHLEAMVSVWFGVPFEALFREGVALTRALHAALSGVAREYVADRDRQCDAAYELLGVLAEFTAGAEDPSACLVRFGPGYRPEPARTAYRHALELEGASTRALRALAVNLEHSPEGRRYADGAMAAEAEELYRRLIAIDPRDSTAIASLATLLARTGREEEARRLLEEALGVMPLDADLELTLGQVLLHRGSPDQALPHVERSVARRPDDARGRRVLARILLALGRYGEALRQAEEGLELEPANADGKALVTRLREVAAEMPEQRREGPDGRR
ncbi:MAG: tetratricopeptide repeat protein [Planctomycetota bacterium]